MSEYIASPAWSNSMAGDAHRAGVGVGRWILCDPDGSYLSGTIERFAVTLSDELSAIKASVSGRVDVVSPMALCFVTHSCFPGEETWACRFEAFRVEMAEWSCRRVGESGGEWGDITAE